jgi:C_GCAxxG_C_C family probable redox protein
VRIMDRIEQAVEKFDRGFSCAQALFSTYAPLFGLDEERALKIATSFGGGMARMADTCGAVTGAFMVLGLAFGRETVEDEAAKERTYELVMAFVEQFKKKHGTIVCRELLGFDMSIPEGEKKLRELNVIADRCPGFVRDAARILEDLLKK